jgi:hypothetical protein
MNSTFFSGNSDAVVPLASTKGLCTDLPVSKDHSKFTSSRSGFFDSPLESLFKFDPQVFFGTLRPLSLIPSLFTIENRNWVSGFSNPRCHKPFLPRIPDLRYPDVLLFFSLAPPGYAPSPRALLLYDRSHTSIRIRGFECQNVLNLFSMESPISQFSVFPINGSSFREISRKF